MKKAKVTQKKSAEVIQEVPSENTPEEFRNPFFLKGKALMPLVNKELFDSTAAVEKKFRSAKEFEQLVSLNSKTLFGQHSFFIPYPAKAELFGKGIHPAGFLLDLNDPVKPNFYVVEIQLSNQDFYAKIFARISRFVSYFKNQQSFEKLGKLVMKNKKVEAELKEKIKASEIVDYMARTIVNWSFILFITDGEIKELSEVMGIYSNELKMVKIVFIRKFSSNGNTICTIVPHFSEIHANGKKRIPNAPVTEEYHLEGATEEIKSIYSKIKAELLKVNNQLQFNPQKYYISLRKNKNLAFFHISKKKITLVIMNPEKDTRKQIKHHEVKTLTEKVQKFWNGPSCSIMIEGEIYLQEVLWLLKKLVKK